jgi:hypothetical protein
VDFVQVEQDKSGTKETIDYQRRPEFLLIFISIRYLSKATPEFSCPRRSPSHAEHQHPEKQPDIPLN